MKCRIATIDDFKKLWNYSNSNTYKYFVNGISSGNIELLTIENDSSGELVGELYIFWDSEDKEEANGVSRAYLCALRVEKEYRGRGLSSLLIKKAKKRATQKGFKELTIGIDNDDYEKLSAIYKKWGFDVLVKSTNIDLHYIVSDNQPVEYEESFDIRLCRL